VVLKRLAAPRGSETLCLSPMNVISSSQSHKPQRISPQEPSSTKRRVPADDVSTVLPADDVSNVFLFLSVFPQRENMSCERKRKRKRKKEEGEEEEDRRRTRQWLRSSPSSTSSSSTSRISDRFLFLHEEKWWQI
jgi:hypothetical protein